MRHLSPRHLLAIAVLLLLVVPNGWGQADSAYTPTKSLPQDSGPTGLKQELQRLHTTARLMHLTAHPDDEDGGMLVLESRGRGATVLLQTLNRGEGGQNKLGSNLFDELGVLRTLELLASDQYYGAQQRFTRVADFGFSKTPEESFAQWHGHDTALADIVRVIRIFRPDVLTSRFQGSAADGHGHHQAAGILAREAFRAAADPARFPEQIREGLQPWQPKKLYTDGFRASEDYTVKLDTGAVSPLLGVSYVQFAMQGLRHQLSQGAGSWNVSPGPHFSFYKLADSVLPRASSENDYFDGIDTRLQGLASRLSSRAPAFLPSALEKMEQQIETATTAADKNPADAAGPLLSGLELTRDLIAQVNGSSLSAADKSELLAELHTKEEQFERAANLAGSLELRGFVDPPGNGMVVPGQSFRAAVELLEDGHPLPRECVQQIALDVPRGWTALPAPPAGHTAEFTITVPADAEVTRPYAHRSDPETQSVYTIDDPRYVTLPLPPPPVRAHAVYNLKGKQGTIAEFVRGGPAPNSPPVAVVPAFSVLIDPVTQVVPTGTPARNVTRGIKVKVEVRHYGPPMRAPNGDTSAPVSKPRLDVPSGWQVTNSSATTDIKDPAGSATVFDVLPPRPYRQGRYDVHAAVDPGYPQGFSVVTREDLGTFYYYQPAIQHVSMVDVKLPTNLTIGYVMGAGDEIPMVLKELGFDVTLLSPEQVHAADLGQFGTIVLGIRAYDTRPDVKDNNQRLLDYVSHGGTLVVQYNSSVADFNAGHFTPYPASLSRERVSVEQAPVTIFSPNDPVFTYPNVITSRDFGGWVQERGLYFMDHWDSHFQPLLACADPGQVPQEGGLLRARYGEGTYIYTGYAFFRQLPTGVPGAIRLFVNLVSAGHESH